MIGLLIKAKTEGVIERAKPILEDLVKKAGFYLQPSLFTKVVNILDEE